jgi:hypothetical protein
MSELIQSRSHADTRLRLLATASVLSLLTAITPVAARDDADRPTVWIELGGQLEALSNTQDQFAPPFLTGPPPLAPRPWGGISYYGIGTLVDPGFPNPFAVEDPLGVQSPPHQSFGGEGKISFQPHGSDWSFSAAVRYGRSNGHKSAQQAFPVQPYVPNDKYGHNGRAWESLALFEDARADYSESHAILDFQVGRDVGVGLLGPDATSTVNFGVRFAQLVTKSGVRVDAIPNILAYAHTTIAGSPVGAGQTKYSFRFQSYNLRAQSDRSFSGLGPSLSWTGSSPLVGNADGMEVALDWGINGALLFGHQKAEVSHHTAHHDRLMMKKSQSYDQNLVRYDNYSPATARGKSVTVPNIGAFAGMSVNFPNAKVSLGYRADFFFGAMDAGIDARRTADVSFHGPFATISVGLGG